MQKDSQNLRALLILLLSSAKSILCGKLYNNFIEKSESSLTRKFKKFLLGEVLSKFLAAYQDAGLQSIEKQRIDKEEVVTRYPAIFLTIFSFERRVLNYYIFASNIVLRSIVVLGLSCDVSVCILQNLFLYVVG